MMNKNDQNLYSFPTLILLFRYIRNFLETYSTQNNHRNSLHGYLWIIWILWSMCIKIEPLTRMPYGTVRPPNSCITQETHIHRYSINFQIGEENSFDFFILLFGPSVCSTSKTTKYTASNATFCSPFFATKRKTTSCTCLDVIPNR